MAAQATTGHAATWAGHLTGLRAATLDLLQEMTHRGLSADLTLSAVVAGVQRAANELGVAQRALDDAAAEASAGLAPAGTPTVRRLPATPPLSQDAAIVLGLAATAVPFAGSLEEEAERWLRVLRVHGCVGVAMQALGIQEAPLETPAQPKHMRVHDPRGETAVGMVSERAGHMALRRGTEVIGTIDLLFAVLEVYGRSFDAALYARGTSRDELLARLAEADRDRLHA
jgi:hypothetical protein